MTADLLDKPVIGVPEADAGLEAPRPESRSYLDDALNILQAALRATRHPLFVPIALAVVGLLALFWPMTKSLFGRWTQDQYYSHGFLVPFLAVWIVVKRWPTMANIPATPSSWPLLPAFLGLPFLMVAYSGNQLAVLSVLFVAYALLAICFVAGRRWMFALLPAVAFLLFALPAWNSFIDAATNPLQLMSSKVAFQILQGTGFHPTQFDNQSTVIYLDIYRFEVAVACSGMKLLLAVTAFTSLFLLIANVDHKVAVQRKIEGATEVRERVWLWLRGVLTPFNIVLLAMIVPLCLVMNGLRIAMIGMVGEIASKKYDPVQGGQMAETFHDWSGYIMLGLCFILLFKFARLFGWKD